MGLCFLQQRIQRLDSSTGSEMRISEAVEVYRTVQAILFDAKAIRRWTTVKFQLLAVW
jgi:hypothetical protein